MFSGLITNIGIVTQNNKKHVRVRTSPMKTKNGDSIAINGVCLTVTDQKKSGGKLELGFDVSSETIKKTTLGQWKIGAHVNLEPALKAADAMGGHIVQGHVDGRGKVGKIVDLKTSWELWIESPKEILKYVVPKGSITVDGVSLTAVKVTSKGFSVALIPFTWTHTNLGKLKAGASVNLEADIIGKYVERVLNKK